METGGVGTPAAYWRSVNGNILCTGKDGDAMSFEPIVSLPHILVVRVDTNESSSANDKFSQWNFPHIVYPYGTNAAAKDAGVVYELVARTFHNGVHYIGQFSVVTSTPTRQKAVFTYDGMRNKGFSIKEKGGSKALLGGTVVEKLPEHYHTSAVLYLLQGGRHAQDWVWERQTTALKAHIGLDLGSSPEEARNSTPVFTKVDYSKVPLREQFSLDPDQKSARAVFSHRKHEYEAPQIERPNTTVDPAPADSSLSEPQNNDSTSTSHLTKLRFSAEDNASVISIEKPPSSSSHESTVPFQCRCGETEDGDRQTIKQKIIQCEAIGCDYQEVHIHVLVDALMNDTQGRRRIRLGRFTTTRELNSEPNEIEEGQTPLTSQKYTTEIHRALESHTDSLKKRIFTPETCNPANYPSIQYQKDHNTRIVPLTGGLPHSTRSRVINWMYNIIPGLKERKDFTWVTDGGLQEALMRLIAQRDYQEFANLKGCPKPATRNNSSLMRKHGIDLISIRANSRWKTPASDRRRGSALSLLEDAMFLPDLNPGLAGQQQWGLDVGIHQDNWDPYIHFPDSQGRINHVWENGEVGEKYRTDPYTQSWNQESEQRKATDGESNDLSKRRTRPRPIAKSTCIPKA
ncbi:hypothetical protein PQX77_008770 [Marasmius sp. AFHP31]|nr:hypothetical protein PQX77_008770 [Marasmius sp. AFHP31]